MPQSSLEREIEEELAFHLAEATAEGQRRGLCVETARARAVAAFGSPAAVRRACVEVYGGPRRRRLALLTVIACAAVSLWWQHSPRWARVSPFVAVAHGDATVRVSVPHRGEFELLAIDGLPVSYILAACDAEYGALCEKRFAEDLVEVLQASGHDPGSAVDLTVRDAAGADAVVLHDEPMTRANRRTIWRARRDACSS